jgi:Flp pilus assembly protein TadD
VLDASIAGSLTELSGRLEELGRSSEALVVLEDAVEIYRELASNRPDEFRPHLADVLGRLGAVLAALGRDVEAETARREAVALGGAPG